MNNKVSKELSKHRLQQAKDDLRASEILYRENLYKSANNRAYYSIFHSIKAVLALEPIDFKRHKDVIAYFNKNYVSNETFPKKMGRKISIASRMREDSDYEDEFVVESDDTKEQIETARELLVLVETYIEEN